MSNAPQADETAGLNLALSVFLLSQLRIVPPSLTRKPQVSISPKVAATER